MVNIAKLLGGGGVYHNFLLVFQVSKTLMNEDKDFTHIFFLI
jgi:hypothetical protein